MSESTPLRVMSIMAHQDDFEFTAGGTFALLRRTYGQSVQLRVVATSRGASGHHEMNLEETFRRREGEARAAAALVGGEYECLTCLDGSHVHAQVFPDRNVLGGLWNAIRAFEPDAIFCPPVPNDPLAGIHIDHEATAHAVRRVAYQLMVPHAYPTLWGPVKQRVASPLIINVDDSYTGEAAFDVRQDISEVYDTKLQMALSHESQMLEWLPFVRGGKGPLSREDWIENFRRRHLSLNARYGQKDETPSEYFRVTRWGRAPREGELERIFPKAIPARA